MLPQQAGRERTDSNRGTAHTGRRYIVANIWVVNLGTGVADSLPGNLAGLVGGTPHGTHPRSFTE